MTCVLSGAFSQDGSHYGPGDFDLGDVTIDHQPVVDPVKIAFALWRCRVIFDCTV